MKAGIGGATWLSGSSFGITRRGRPSLRESHIIKVTKGPDHVTHILHAWVYGDPGELWVSESYEDVMARLTSEDNIPVTVIDPTRSDTHS